MVRCVCMTIVAVALFGCAASKSSSEARAPVSVQKASAGSEDARGPKVTLSFAWPAGLVLRVRTLKLKEKLGSTTGGESTSRMRSEAIEGGLRVIEDDYSVAVAREGADSGVQTKAANAALSEMRTITEVASDGTFRRLANGEEMFEGTLRMLGDRRTPETEKQMRALMSPELLNSVAETAWDERVGFWLGGELELGATYETRGEAVVPVPGQVSAKMVTRFSAVAMVPCLPGQPPTCVHLETETAIDPDDFARVVHEVRDAFRAAGGSAPDMEIDHLEVTTATALVTDPRTLVPYRFTKRKLLDFTLRTPEGSQRTLRGEEERNEYERVE